MGFLDKLKGTAKQAMNPVGQAGQRDKIMRLNKEGVQTTATVNAMTEVGTQLGGGHQIDFDLTVHPEGGEDYQVKVSQSLHDVTLKGIAEGGTISSRSTRPTRSRCSCGAPTADDGPGRSRTSARRMTRAVENDDRPDAESLGPLIADDSTAVERWLRRTRGIALILVAFVLVTVLSPLLVLAAFVADLTLWLTRRKPWMALRLVAMLWWFLLGEMYGLVGLMLIGLASGGRDSPRRRDRVFRLKRRWLGSHLGAIKTLFWLRFRVRGPGARRSRARCW